MSGVGQIDPSIAVNANRPQVDLLGTAGQAVGIQNALLQGSQQRQALQQGQLGIDTTKLALAQAHYQALGSLFSSALNVPAAGTKMPDGTISQGLTDEYLHAIAQRGIAMGLMTPDQAAQELAVMPPDDAGKRQQLRELLFSVQDNATRLQALAPPSQFVNTGQGLTPYQFKANAPPEQTGPTVNTGVPATRMQTVDTDPNSPNYGATQSAIVPGGGGPGAGPAAATASNGTVQTSLPPGSDTYRQAGAARAANLAASVQNIPQQRTLLNTLDTELQSLPPEAIGPGSHLIQRGSQWLQEFAGGVGSPLTDEQTGTLDTFAKTAQQLANELLPTIGNSSDRSQLAAVASNPNQYLSKNGVQRITALLKGSVDALAAKNHAFQQSGEPPGNFNAWEDKFNQDFDTRAFQLPYMTDEQKRELISSLGGRKSAAFQKFQKFFNHAADSGWIPSITPQGQ